MIRKSVYGDFKDKPPLKLLIHSSSYIFRNLCKQISYKDEPNKELVEIKTLHTKIEERIMNRGSGNEYIR